MASKNKISPLTSIGILLLLILSLQAAKAQTTFKMPTRPYGAAIVDYDLDGDNDVIIGSSDPFFHDPDSIVIMFNDGWGNFEILGFEANSGIFIFCDDLTNDGYPDIISRDADSIFFHENDQKGGLGNYFTICDTYGNRMVNGIADMDTNGFNDIIYYHNQYDHGWGIVYNQGQNQFSDSYFYSSDTDGWLRPHLGDLNLDNIEDVLVTSNVKESGVFVLLNNVSSFEKKAVIQEAWFDGVIVDINNNDTNDLFIYKNRGTVSIENKALLYQNGIDLYNFIDTVFFIGGGKLGSFDDFNQDGFPDIALYIASWESDPSEDSVYIYLNDQNWGFYLNHRHFIGDWFNPVLVSGDLNMDGYPEIVTLGYYNPTIDHIQILWNDRTGGFIDTNNVYVGYNETGLNEDVILFPNPSNGVVQIKSPVYKIKEITITDYKGSILVNKLCNTNSTQLDLNFAKHNPQLCFCIIKFENNDIQYHKLLILK